MITMEEYAAVCMAVDAYGKLMGYEEPIKLSYELLDELATKAREAANVTHHDLTPDEPVTNQ